VARSTKETTIEVSVDLDGTGATDVSTGLPFFDHMLSQLGRHGAIDLVVSADGDLEVDAHHTVEDVGIALGGVVAEALGDKAGVRRFASISLPLDEALVDVALDLSGRPFLAYGIEFAPDTPGLGSPPFDPQLAEEFWRAFVTAAAVTLHVRLVTGRNTHHIIEASFKAVARSLKDAMRVEGGGVPSTKGTL
jgi:imidazoleglycerol-phosphate dehydratase